MSMDKYRRVVTNMQILLVFIHMHIYNLNPLLPLDEWRRQTKIQQNSGAGAYWVRSEIVFRYTFAIDLVYIEHLIRVHFGWIYTDWCKILVIEISSIARKVLGHYVLVSGGGVRVSDAGVWRHAGRGNPFNYLIN